MVGEDPIRPYVPETEGPLQQVYRVIGGLPVGNGMAQYRPRRVVEDEHRMGSLPAP